MGRRGSLGAALAKHSRVGLDSSVLIYHLEGLAPYAALTKVVIAELARGAFTALISTISVTEILVKPLSDGAEDKVQICKAFLEELPNALFVPPSVAIAEEAARLRAVHKLRTPDALLIATALEEGATAFLTNDERLRRVEAEGISLLVLRDYVGS
ncbi:TPA: PIN domain nuclease [Candidatus Acetothermia bacterium]|nr:PIN domain nuclease [Candidatus Acetothermia bacterium]HAZ30035.1 PIN domain nuclease [Candidatus Acetothermia bacterium]